MHSHLVAMALFAFFVSLVFSVLAKDTPREQARLGGLMFVGFMLAGLAVAWLLYPFPLR
jgi:protein-S-isoprenylcysteine O-methyltransferase Ste14